MFTHTAKTTQLFTQQNKHNEVDINLSIEMGIDKCPTTGVTFCSETKKSPPHFPSWRGDPREGEHTIDRCIAAICNGQEHA